MAICYDIHIWGIPFYKYTKLIMKEESGKKEDITRKKGNDISEKVELLTVEEEERVSKIFSYKSMIAYKLNGS